MQCAIFIDFVGLAEVAKEFAWALKV